MLHLHDPGAGVPQAERDQIGQTAPAGRHMDDDDIGVEAHGFAGTPAHPHDARMGHFLDAWIVEQ